MHKYYLFSYFFCLFMHVFSSKHELDRISVDGDNHWFYDTSGRVVLFHGINSVKKSFPWYYDTLLDETYLNDLEEFGINVVRLGSMWTGVEPVEGEFNETYVEILSDIIDGLSSRGIYVILDMHQDVLSTSYGAYDGVPPWLIDYFPQPTNPYPWPFEEIQDENWVLGYLTQACSEGFQCIYNNTENALSKWSNFWNKLAEIFKDNPSVLGYEYINEPWVGDYFQDGNLLLPGVAGRQNVMPSYDFLTAELRKIDPQNGIVFYEPVIIGQLYPGYILGSGFDHVPGGDSNRNLSAYSWHSYCWGLESLDSNATDSEKEEARDYCIEEFIPKMFQTTQENMNKTGGAGILSEFGLCIGYEETDEIGMPCEEFVNIADEFLHSWIEWDYNDGKWYDDNGNPQWEKILPYVRPFARRTAGVPLKMVFNSSSLDFRFEYEANLELSSPTEIFAPNARYSQGYQVIVSEGFRVETNDSTIYIYPEADNQDITEATIEISSSA